jgi:hypothetical protein
VSQIRYGVTVVFHNGTSKLAIDYLLAWKGQVPASSVASDLGGGNDYISLNDSSSSWTQASLDLRADFIKYYHFDPVARGYCINYVSLWQISLSASVDIMPTSYTAGTRSYCFFDDVELVPIL